MAGIFIDVKLAPGLGVLRHVGRKLAEACPVDIFHASDAGVEIVEEIAWNNEFKMKSFFVRAPDGVLVEIVEADPLPDASWLRHIQ